VLSILASGLLLGLSCGLAPGPLMTIVVTQSLRHGWREGCKVALVPLITDAPIIVLSLGVASRAAQMQPVLGTLSLAGGLFVLYLAVDTFRATAPAADATTERPKSLLKGTLANILSPNPWFFWMTVGAATLAKAVAVSWLAALAFLALFYALLVGAKMLVGIIAGRSRDVLEGRAYHAIMQLLGLLLAVFGVLLLVDGGQRLLG